MYCSECESVCLLLFCFFFSVFFLSRCLFSFCSPMPMNSAYRSKQKTERKKERKEEKTSDSFVRVCVPACLYLVHVCEHLWLISSCFRDILIFFIVIFVICLCSCRHFIMFVWCVAIKPLVNKHTQRSCVTDSSRTTLSLSTLYAVLFCFVPFRCSLSLSLPHELCTFSCLY